MSEGPQKRLNTHSYLAISSRVDVWTNFQVTPRFNLENIIYKSKKWSKTKDTNLKT